MTTEAAKKSKATEYIDETTGEILPVNGDSGVGHSIAKFDSSQMEVSFDGGLPDVSQLADLKIGKRQNAKYRTQEDWQEMKDKPVRCFYMGTKTITNDKGEELTAAVFVEEDGPFICSQTIILSAVQYLRSRTPLIITFTGKKPNKSSTGSTNMFDIMTLVPKD